MKTPITFPSSAQKTSRFIQWNESQYRHTGTNVFISRKIHFHKEEELNSSDASEGQNKCTQQQKIEL